MSKRAKLITLVGVIAVVVIAVVVTVSVLIFGAPKTVALNQTPVTTKTPRFTVGKVAGFVGTTPTGIATTSATNSVYLAKNGKQQCVAEYTTAYLDASQKGYGDDYLTKSYLTAVTNVNTFKKSGLSTVYVKTAAGGKIAFTSMHYTNSVGAVKSTDGKRTAAATNLTTYIAVRAIDSSRTHKVVKSIGPDQKPVYATATGVPVLEIEYQCANQTLNTKDWQNVLAGATAAY